MYAPTLKATNVHRSQSLRPLSVACGGERMHPYCWPISCSLLWDRGHTHQGLPYPTPPLHSSEPLPPAALPRAKTANKTTPPPHYKITAPPQQQVLRYACQVSENLPLFSSHLPIFAPSSSSAPFALAFPLPDPARFFPLANRRFLSFSFFFSLTGS